MQPEDLKIVNHRLLNTRDMKCIAVLPDATKPWEFAVFGDMIIAANPEHPVLVFDKDGNQFKRLEPDANKTNFRKSNR